MDKLSSCLPLSGSGKRVPVIETGPHPHLFTTGICKRTGRRIGCKGVYREERSRKGIRLVTSPGWGE